MMKMHEIISLEQNTHFYPENNAKYYNWEPVYFKLFAYFWEHVFEIIKFALHVVSSKLHIRCFTIIFLFFVLRTLLV